MKPHVRHIKCDRQEDLNQECTELIELIHDKSLGLCVTTLIFDINVDFATLVQYFGILKFSHFFLD